MNAVKPSRYIMEDVRESRRLRDKVDESAFVAKYIQPHLVQAGSVLDVGCGSGVITAEIARLRNDIQVVGIDMQPKRFLEVTQENQYLKNLAFVPGDASDMPFPDNSFDFVFTRFLLEYMKKPEQVIDEIVRVARKGAKIMLQDLDGQLLTNYPENESLQSRRQKVLDYLATTGFDPYIGRKLFFLSKKAGLTDITLNIEPYHMVVGAMNSKDQKLWELKLDIIMPHAAVALGSKEEAQKLKSDFLKYLMDESTLTFSNLFTLIARK